MCNHEPNYKWIKEINEMPKINGFLSDEALTKLIKIGHDTSRPEAERNYAIDWYCSAT